MATLLLSVMGSFASITLAKQRGAYRSRKKSLTGDQVDRLICRAGAGETKSALAGEFNMSRETVYRYLRAARSAAPA